MTKLTESNLSFVKIKKLDKISQCTKMVDFYVPNHNSFIANSILVHNCIIQAALHGTAIDGNTSLYTTIFPCMSCLKLIINAKIRRLIYKEGYNMENIVKAELIKNSNIQIIKLI